MSTASATSGTLYQFFAPGGVLAKTHPAYEFRRGQLQMAEAVQQALNDKRHLIVEAGTGTGKTLAYLLPILRSGKRVIVSTGTKNLQEQLFYKDIPFLSQHMPELKVCYMKGRNNYLCRKKLYDLADQPVLSGLDEVDQYEAIVEWDKVTQTGDRAELAVLPESSLLWPKLDARNDTCIGQKCQQWERCFITEMHRKAIESDVIIVNHHLFFADLAIKMAADGAPDAGILPEAAAVVFDEAHELEDVAGGYFGVSISTARFEEVVRDAERMLDREKVLSASLQQALESMRERAQFFFALLPQGPGGRAESRFPFERRAEFLEENGDGYISLQRAITRVTTELQALSKKPEELHNLVRRCEELRVHLGFILESKDRNTVFWIERRGGRPDPRSDRRPRLSGREHVYLQATPIDVSEILRHSLFDQYETIVLTSATLAVGGGFAYLKQRLGLENAREMIVPPHFNYEEQALLYIPPDLPDPREPQFAPRAADRIRRILEISRGRAFCLFTSYAQMRDLHDRLQGELEYPMLIQGSAPKGKLLEEFRSTANCVLFATASFWQGVDVQGEQLSCVIIDRLPFAVPNDPVVAARIHAINEGGGNAFADYQVPAAVITLKQGFGRLIRSLQDRGVLALLDNRILKKQYGKTFLSSLPPYKRTTQLSDVEGFFGA